MRLTCYECGKSVSTEVSDDTIVRGLIICPECIEKSKGDQFSVTGYADIGSHEKIFEFSAGPVADKYPHLLHIYSEKVTPDLKEVKISWR